MAEESRPDDIRESGSSFEECRESALRSSEDILGCIEAPHYWHTLAKQRQRYVVNELKASRGFLNVLAELLALMHFLMPEKCEFST